jgi:hypothetical protein
MAKLPGMKALPWMRVVWATQIVLAAIRELEAHERKQAREIAGRVYHDHRLSPGDRQHLFRLARKASMGAAKGARGKR